MKNFRFLASTLTLLLFGVGCSATSNISRVVTAKSEYHEELSKERAELKRLEREIALAEIQRRKECRLEQIKKCQGETIPEVEAALGMRVRQRFEIGEPELDVAAAKEIMDEAVKEYEYQMKTYRDELAQWEIDRKQFQKQSGAIASTSSYSGSCDDSVPALAFMLPKPKKPVLSIAATEIPMKLSMRIGTKIDRAKVGEVTTRQIRVPGTAETYRTTTRCCDDFACADSPDSQTLAETGETLTRETSAPEDNSVSDGGVQLASHDNTQELLE